MVLVLAMVLVVGGAAPQHGRARAGLRAQQCRAARVQDGTFVAAVASDVPICLGDDERASASCDGGVQALSTLQAEPYQYGKNGGVRRVGRLQLCLVLLAFLRPSGLRGPSVWVKITDACRCAATSRTTGYMLIASNAC